MKLFGFVKRMIVQHGNKEYTYTFDTQRSWKKSKSKHVGLMLGKGTSEILIVPWKPKPIKKPGGVFKLEWKTLKLSRIGTIREIEYLAEEPDGSFQLYQHKFRRAASIHTDRKEINFAIRAKRLLSSRGIVA